MVNRILKKYKSDKRFDLMGHRYLYWASVMGREDIAISLIHYQYSPFVMSYKGRNSVHAAAFHNHLHLLRLFFESEITRK
jgi:ankyrin repeat protein